MCRLVFFFTTLDALTMIGPNAAEERDIKKNKIGRMNGTKKRVEKEEKQSEEEEKWKI